MEPNQRFEYLVSTLLRFRKLWIVPAIAGVLLSGLYVFVVRSPTYTARQSLIVRDNMLGQSFKPGQFSSLESMKSAQETILEIARKPDVIRKTLKELGPESKSILGSDKNYPSEKVIEQVQGTIEFSAPNGAEFGKTEVIILNTKAGSRERSKQFIEILLDNIDSKTSEVRAKQLTSMESEMKQARDAAFLSLEQSAKKLQAMENKLGADISTMHGLNNQSNDGAQLEIVQIRIERRAVQAELQAAKTSLETLAAAKRNPQQTLAASGTFLQSQPKLQGLQTALVDAQKAFANNVGRFQPSHPAIRSSEATIDAIEKQIYQELDTLERSVHSYINTLQSNISRLNGFETKETDRLASLGTQRIDHLTINSEVAKKTELLNNTQSELAEIQAFKLASQHVNWLTRVDAPQVATRPDGLGKKATILAGGICGLMMGLGLVMLIAPPMPTPSEGRPGRRSDLSRRVADNYLAPPSLDEIVGPTAANAIHSASATVNKGVSMAKSAMSNSSMVKSRHDSDSVEHEKTPDEKIELNQSPIERLGSAPEGKPATRSTQSKDPTPSDPSPVPAGDPSPAPAGDPSPAPAGVATPSPAPSQAVAFQQAAAQVQDAVPAPVRNSASEPTPSLPTAAEILAQIRLKQGVGNSKDENSKSGNEATLAGSESDTKTPNVTEKIVGLDTVDANEVADKAAGLGKPAENNPAENNPAENKPTNIKPAEISPASQTIQLDAVPNFDQVRRTNVRPIDLAKSAQRNSFASPAEAASGSESDDSGVVDKTPTPRSYSENPFLKNLPPRLRNAHSASSAQPRPQPEPETSSLAENLSVEENNDDHDPSAPIPQQIRSLAESIANFAKPKKINDRPKPGDEF